MANQTGNIIESGLNFSSISILSCKVSEYEIKDLIKIITIEESIYNKLLKGTVIFKDAEDVFKKYLDLVVGEVTINIQLSSPSTNPEVFELSFLLDSYNPVIQSDNDDSQYMILNLMDSSISRFKKEYSTSFKEMAGTDFIKSLSKDVLQKDLETDYSFIEPSSNKLSLAFPYQRFKYILSYLNQYLVSDNGYTNYIYFSNLLGSNFVTLSYLSNQTPQYAFAEQKASLVKNVANKDLFSLYVPVNKTTYREMSKEFALGSTKFMFDPITKSLVTTELTDYNTSGVVALGGKYSNFDKNLIDSKNRTYYSSTVSTKSQMAVMRGMFNFGDEIVIPNMEGDISRQAGRVVSVLFKNIDDTSKYNKSTSSNYLITNIIHNIYPKAYKQDITILRTAKEISSSTNQVEFTKYNSLNNV